MSEQEALDLIRKQVTSNDIVVFVKGTKQSPQCGFSGQVAQILGHLGVDYKDNVLDDPRVREGIKSYTNWPTIPQLYVKGEFVGGCDIVREMFQSGELQELLNQKGVPTARRVAGAEILSMGGVLPPD
jgi:monothiol glutaredoxin